MSSQLDEPYTRITNEILEEIAKRPFNGSQYAIIITILRNTYGYQRKSHGLSLTFIADATNTNRNQVKRELDKLIEMNVIKVYSESSYTSSREIGFNKYFSEWQLEDCTLKRVQPPKKRTVSEKAVRGVRELESQERKKETQEEERAEPRTAMDAYRFAFNKFQYTGYIQGYVVELLGRGFTDAFIRELFLEMGARGIGPDERYMRKMAEDWIVNGIYTRVEAERRKQANKVVNHPAVSAGEREAQRQQELAKKRAEEGPADHEYFESLRWEVR